MIFIFRQYNSDKQIVVYAESYLEAKDALFEFNAWADKIYNILEYIMYNVDYEKYCDTLNIDYDDGHYPRILSSREFNNLCESNDHIILDKQFKDLNHLRVIQKKDAGEYSNLMTTSEFVGMLKQNAETKEHFKHEISKMLAIVGDIWFIKFRKANGINHLLCDDKGKSFEYYIYGKSRNQCIELFNDLIDTHKQHCCPKPELLISIKSLTSEYKDYTNDDVTNYIRMVNYMNSNNIKKFPFSTLDINKIED
jgi:hypothetical protein